MAVGFIPVIWGGVILPSSAPNVGREIALDVGEAAHHFSNPYLPETRSEMALPLRGPRGVIGALAGALAGAVDIDSRWLGRHVGRRVRIAGVVEALRRNAHQKDYLPVKGLYELRRAVAEYYRRSQGLQFTWDNVIVGPGSKEHIDVFHT